MVSWWTIIKSLILKYNGIPAFPSINTLLSYIFQYPVINTNCSEQLSTAWNHKKTVKENMSAMGLAYDPNTVTPMVATKVTISQKHFIWNVSMF